MPEHEITTKGMLQIIEGGLFKECIEMFKRKNASYAGKDAGLANFNRGAKLTGIDRKKVWFIYFSKHYDSIASYIRGEYADSTEPIEGRIKDLINYLGILCCMIREDEMNKENKEEVEK